MITRHVTLLTSLTEHQQRLVLSLALVAANEPEAVVRDTVAGTELTLADLQFFQRLLNDHLSVKTPEPVKIQFTHPVISVDRAVSKLAVFDDFTMVRPFRLYSNEKAAIEEAKQWIKASTDLPIDVVYPSVTKITATTGKQLKRKT